ncbi:hypothetical protein LKV13_02655 [Borrelia sp. BU AG58]|uniref:hypothetical protein n=1 Tax=Borrelia sp. BU AG58 TaxID=2887345 RepID=UPI001E65C06D|nr:hypothetical protein [Borrelia sp. BU AG58]UER67690.1 hypothetical protein LKV13_02655 [Borrelia sp. BU AG58]
MKKYLSISFFNLLVGMLILFFIIFIQFRDLSQSVFLLKDLKLLVSNKVEDSKYALNNITLSVRGMRINLSKESPLIIPSSELYLNPVSYRLQHNEVHVYFENNVFLLFAFDPEDNFSISSNLSRKLILNYEIEDDYKIFFDKDVLIRGKDCYFEIFLGENTQINEREILIGPQEFFKIGNLIKEIEKPKDLVTKEAPESISLDMSSSVVYVSIEEVEKGVFDSAIVRFKNKAYNAWSSDSAFSVKQGGWLKDSVYSFDEEIFVYLLAESLTRLDHEDIFSKLEPLMNLNEHKLTYLSSSYYVNEEKLDKFFSYLSVNKTFINSLESDKLLGYLKEDSSLLEKIFLSENASLFSEALDILKEPEIVLNFDFNVIQAYNILSNYIVFLKLNDDSFVFGKLKKELANFISTLFLVSSNGRAYIPSDRDNLSWDFEYTLKVAGLLKRLAYELGDDLILRLSFNAIYYALMSKEVDRIPYEAYYADIVDNDYLPKFILIPSAGIGNWIYGASKISNYNISDVSYSLDFNRSLNSPGYFFFKGISNPTLVRFRSINWYTDPQFYIYSDGWKYYPGNKMLVLKITPKKNEDTNILLRFDDIKITRNIDE